MIHRGILRAHQCLTCRRALSMSASDPTTRVISVNNERTDSDVRQLVRRRVKERDQWKVHGEVAGPLSIGTILNFMMRHLPEMIRFQPPSQAELDEVFPVLEMDWETIRTPPDPTKIQLTWLGHASMLVQMNGCNIVTDPVFSDRASATDWFGPKRYRPPPCTVAELCQQLGSNNIDLILISHNHYDHLDYKTVVEFSQRSQASFVVPLGLRQWFRKHVSEEAPIYEQDWHESIEYEVDGEKKLTIECLPMRHWSNRTGDRDQTLWCGYSIKSNQKKFLFPGDTAWFDGLTEVASRYGPWDVAAIPIGAYEPRDFMKANHINVEEAIRMKDTMEVKTAVPIHWGTWPLTIEPVMEPRELLLGHMSSRKDADSFQPWSIGQTRVFY